MTIQHISSEKSSQEKPTKTQPVRELQLYETTRQASKMTAIQLD